MDWYVNVYEAIERTTAGVVTAIDGTLQCFVLVGVINQTGILAMVVYMSLINIAGLHKVISISSTEDTAYIDGGTVGHVYHRPAHYTLIETASIRGTHLSANQVDNSRNFVKVITGSCRFAVCFLHANAAVAAATKDFGKPEIIHFIFIILLGNVYQHIAAALVLVALSVAGITCTATEDTIDFIILIEFGTDIHKRT